MSNYGHRHQRLEKSWHIRKGRERSVVSSHTELRNVRGVQERIVFDC